MELLGELTVISDAERAFDLERLSKRTLVKGDFEGSVTGHWVILDEEGAGVVEFNSKKYHTETIGFVSLPKGTAVELSFADGTYYSKY